VAYDTTSTLIPAIKRRAMLPTTQSTYQTADFLAVLNSELQATLVPLLMSVREEYFVADSDTAMVVGQSAYDIPSAAVGGDLRQVLAVSAQDGSTRPLARFEPEQVTGLPTGNGTPYGFVVKDEQVVLYPPPQNTLENLRLSYHRRPNTLVDASACGVVTATTSSTITFTGSPSIPNSGGTPFDVVKASPQFKAISLTVGGNSGGVITVSGTVPSSVAIGDYVCVSGQSPVPQIPAELHPLLVLRAVCVIAQGLGDGQLLQMAQAELTEKQRLALILIANRVKSNVRKVPNGMNRWRGPWSGRWPY
jgi:hypothetical protein